MIVSKTSSVRSTQSSPYEFLGVIQRRKTIIAIVVLFAVAVTGALGFLKRPRYVATSSVALNARTIQAVPQDAVVSRLPHESPVLRTELDVITSRAMAEEVAKRVGPDRLLNALSERAESMSLRRAVAEIVRRVGLSQNIAELPDSDSQTKEIVNFLLSGLQADNDGRSFTIFISFSAEDPVLAAQVANAYADAYLNLLASIQTSATRGVSEWLAERTEELRGRLELSERAVQSFRQSAELVEANGMTLQGNRLNALNLELIQARSGRAAAEARLEIARRLQASDKGLDAFGEVLRSPVIQSLRQQEAQVMRAVQDLQNSGATQSAQYASLKNQQVSLQQHIADEIGRIIDSLASEVEVALRREKDIEEAISEAWGKTAQESKDFVRLQQLEREANANRAIYESFLNRYKQTIEQEGFISPEARLISKADVPSSSSGRNLMALMIFGLMGGGAGGFGLAYLVDRLDRRVRSGLRLEEITGVPVIGRIPFVPRAKRLKPQDQVVNLPKAGYSEAVRRLAVAMYQSRFTNEAKVIVVTSPERSEGKSSTCVSLARSIAISGRKVIVIDADLHRPSVADTFGQAPTPDLNGLLSGAKDLDEVVRRDERSGAHFIAAERSQEHPQSLLQGQAFKDLIDGLRERYDIVIVDSPPVCAAIDAALMGRYADVLLLVVRWGKTSDAAVLSVLDELNLLASPVSGIVLNRVDTHRHSYEARYAPADYSAAPPDRRWHADLPEVGIGTAGEKLRRVRTEELTRIDVSHHSVSPMKGGKR